MERDPPVRVTVIGVSCAADAGVAVAPTRAQMIERANTALVLMGHLNVDDRPRATTLKSLNGLILFHGTPADVSLHHEGHQQNICNRSKLDSEMTFSNYLMSAALNSDSV
jgi:hypothetical protein